MNATQILNALERERMLLREFRTLSEQQLMLLETEDMDAVNQLLDQRGDLMLELSAVEATLGTWIDQIRTDPAVTNEVLGELRSLNDDIVQLANQVVDIDEQSHWRLDLIKTRTSSELQTLNKGSRALKGYERGIGGGPSMQCLS
ncbi:MAG TPA: flagellar export chaperone FlgN [Terriglobia bacterium]|nr:flagellar export chaperone FlgN [Terriglobia bacterium]